MSARSRSFGPVAVKPSHRLLLPHGRHLGFGQADASDQQVHKIGWKRSGRWLGHTSVRLDAVANTTPELRLGCLELVAENVAPDARPIRAAVDGMPYPCPQDTSVRQMEFVGDVVSARTTTCVPYRLPSLGAAELVVISAAGLRPGHRPDPTSQSRN